jgi:hypothetical protein
MITILAAEDQQREAPGVVSAGVRTLYVYLCNGDVEAISPAVRLSYGQEHLTIFDGDRQIARFRRMEVYFASFSRISPPVMF